MTLPDSTGHRPSEEDEKSGDIVRGQAGLACREDGRRQDGVEYFCDPDGGVHMHECRTRRPRPPSSRATCCSAHTAANGIVANAASPAIRADMPMSGRHLGQVEALKTLGPSGAQGELVRVRLPAGADDSACPGSTSAVVGAPW